MNDSPDSSATKEHTKWLWQLAYDHFKLSKAGGKPQTRVRNRRKFVEYAKQLLAIVGKEQLLIDFGAACKQPTYSDLAEARAIIEQLAAEPTPEVVAPGQRA